MSAKHPSTPLAGSPGCEIIHVPNVLLQKVGPGFKASAAASIARAERAMNAMAGEFGVWLEQEVAGLEQARANVKESGLTPEIVRFISTKALDLKGLGTTYAHPLVTRIGGSLFKLFDEVAPAAVPMNLIDAHVDAVRAIVRNKIQDPNHPVGVTLVVELERRVREITAKAA